MPALGLSNKAVFEGEESRSSGSGDNVFKYSDQYKENYFSPVHLKGTLCHVINGLTLNPPADMFDVMFHSFGIAGTVYAMSVIKKTYL